MEQRSTADDEGVHEVVDAPNWSENRYVDFWDARTGVGGWFSIANRPNEGHAEVAACIYLPDGTVACDIARVPISENGLAVGAQTWEVVEPWCRTRVDYHGEMVVLADPWVLDDPEAAFTGSPRVGADIDLTCHTAGLESTIGFDHDHVALVFVPGRGERHYQHLSHAIGTVRVGDESWPVDGRGGKDHSWGPPDRPTTNHPRWLTASADDGNGFMLTHVAGPTEQARTGFVLDDGELFLVDGFEMADTHAGAPNFELTGSVVTMRSGDHSWSAIGSPVNWLPLRHRQRNEAGEPAPLRIVKSPARWTFGDGRTATGHVEYHDLTDGDVPAGLHA